MKRFVDTVDRTQVPENIRAYTAARLIALKQLQKARHKPRVVPANAR